jgi:hypothetical protein
MLLAIVLLSLPAASGAVTLDPISQDRRVDVAIQVKTMVCPYPEYPPIASCDEPISTTYEDFSDADSALDFGAFDATAQVPEFPTFAAQESSISPVSLTATGTWSGWADASFTWTIVPPDEIQLIHVTESHVTETHYEVTFELTRTVAFSLTGGLVIDTTAFGGDDNAAIELIGPGATPVAGIDFWAWRDCDFTGSNVCSTEVLLSEAGELAPGVYTLRARGRAFADSSIGSGGFPYEDIVSGSFTVELLIAPPVPALPPGGAVLLGSALVAALGAVRRLPAPPR